MDTVRRETIEQHGPSQIASLYRIIPSAVQSASIEKLDSWLQSTSPGRVEQFVKVFSPTAGRVIPISLKIPNAPAIQYSHRIPYLFLDSRYRIQQAYLLVNMIAKPFTVQLFIVAQDFADRSCLLQIGRRSQFKKDLMPAATRFGLLGK